MIAKDGTYVPRERVYTTGLGQEVEVDIDNNYRGFVLGEGTPYEAHVTVLQHDGRWESSFCFKDKTLSPTIFIGNYATMATYPFGYDGGWEPDFTGAAKRAEANWMILSEIFKNARGEPSVYNKEYNFDTWIHSANPKEENK